MQYREILSNTWGVENFQSSISDCCDNDIALPYNKITVTLGTANKGNIYTNHDLTFYILVGEAISCTFVIGCDLFVLPISIWWRFDKS